MMNTLLEYLKSRKVLDLGFIEFMTSTRVNHKEFKLFSVNNQDYMISRIFDESDAVGFSLIKTNEILETNKTNLVVFAAVEGDDVICFNTADNSIWIWCLQTGNGECIKISDTFRAFIQMII